MKTYLYELICTDDAGWGNGDSLWGYDLDLRKDRIFRTRAEAVAARRDLDAVDYAATTDTPDEPCQPTFAVQRVATVELLTYAALVTFDDGVFDTALRLSGAPSPSGYVIGESDLPSRDEFLAYIETLPRSALRAVIPAGQLDDLASDLSRASASLVGASSATHTYSLMSAYVDEQVRLMRAAAERGLKRVPARYTRSGNPSRKITHTSM